MADSFIAIFGMGFLIGVITSLIMILSGSILKKDKEGRKCRK